MALKINYHSFIDSFTFDILRCITTFIESHSEFFKVEDERGHLRNLKFRRHFNVACELSQPMGKTEIFWPGGYKKNFMLNWLSMKF